MEGNRVLFFRDRTRPEPFEIEVVEINGTPVGKSV
jgi:hypothetical protein